ncbi:MAG: alkaline phosphatase family protein [Rhodothermia bacterium]|nr:MAG: alkaline phosphatase family protein [Rhodothermia bacterium]
MFRPIDAGLGIPGLPQSGTGQASLFTGVNCVEPAGRHFGPFPHSTSLSLIARYNVFSRVKSLGLDVAFANAYPPIFFEHAQRRNRWSVTTRSCLDSDTRIRTLDELNNGQALAADITGQRLIDHLGLQVQICSEAEAAVNLADLTSKNAFTAFEYFHTDKAGHSRSRKEADKCLLSLSSFLMSLIEETLSRGLTLILTSDHGNLENLAIKTHTENPVPFAAIGEQATAFEEVRSLVDVVPGVLTAFSS